MAGLFKAAVIVIAILVVLSIVSKVVAFTTALLSLFFPLLVVGLIAYVIYRLITSKCAPGSHHTFR